MLSGENPPPDPLCPTDERAYGKLEALDLISSDFEEGDRQLPKFSIRDYVFSTRNKDIANNWPFSQNNLQHCLKHGVRDLLPPFESPDLVRNPSCVRCNGETSIVDKGNTGNSSGNPSSSGYRVVTSNRSGSDPDLFLDGSSINPSVSEADKERISTTTSVSFSNIDLCTTDKSSCLDLEAKTLAEPSPEVSEVVVPTASKKRESTNHSSLKKCRLIVKNSNIPHSSTKEVTTVTAPMSSEAMAVCPVCKTFSSSSNTTLNAHMDQCLSGEYLTKSVEDSKVIRHRIKPRKMRSMVDIYKAAPHCTLEELDRRNGSNWASNCSFSPSEVEIRSDQNKQGLRLNVKESPSDGSVYIDANGTKLRILSPFSDLAMDSKVEEYPQTRNLVKGGKGSMGLLAKKIKKMKNQIQKEQKCGRLATHRKKTPASRLHCSSEISNCQDGSILREENDEKDERLMKQLKSSAKLKFSIAGTTRGWMHSKKTGLMKRINGRDEKRHSGECLDGNLRAGPNFSSPTNSRMKKISDLKYPNAYSPSKSGLNDNSSHELHDEYRGFPSLRKRLGTSVDPEFYLDRKRSLAFHEISEPGVDRLGENGSLDRKENIPSLSKRRVEIRKSLVRSADNSAANPKIFPSHHALLSKTGKFSSLRNKHSSASLASDPDSRFPLKRKFLGIKKSMVFSASESDEELLSESGTGQSQDLMQKIGERTRTMGTSSQESFGRGVILKDGSGGSMASRKEKAMVFRSSQSVSLHGYHDQNAEEENGSLVVCGIARHTSESFYSSRTKDDIKQPSEVAVGGHFMRFSNAVKPGFNGLAAQTEAQCTSQQFTEVYKLPLYEDELAVNSSEPVLTSGQDIFCTNAIPESMMIGSVSPMVGVDSSGGQGNYLAEVDQIPIPGPPGSFLPSPRHMDSDDLQGNSSLTFSRVQSPDDHQELGDHSSESPASATSAVSNSNVPRPGSKPSEKVSVEPPRKDVEISGSTVDANVDPAVETCSPATKLNNVGTEIISLDHFLTNITIPNGGSFRHRDEPPSRCSMKEGSLQNVALNYHDPPLLERRTMGSILVSSCGTQMSGGFNGTVENSELSSSVGRPVQGNDGTNLVAELVASSFSNDNDVQFPTCVGREPDIPSPSNPVLRLMGKNLMVIKKVENVYPQCCLPMSNSVIGHGNQCAVSGVYAENFQNGECHGVPHRASQGPGFFHHTETCSAHLCHLDGKLSKCLGNYENLGTQGMSAMNSLSMLVDQSEIVDLASSLAHPEYSGVAPLTYNTEKTVQYPRLLCRATGSATKVDNEIIVVEDNPENEVDLTTAAIHNQVVGFIRDGVVISASVPKSLYISSDARSARANCKTQQYVYGTHGRSPVDTSFLMPPPCGPKSELAKWNHTLETSDMLNATLKTGSSPGAHPRSDYPPGF